MTDYRIVPVEPTDEMLRALSNEWSEAFHVGGQTNGEAWRLAYAAMLSAAPAVDLRDRLIACIRDAADRAFEAGRQGDIHFRFGDIIARADAILAGEGER